MKKKKSRSKSKKIILITVAVFVVLGVIEFARHPDQYLDQAASTPAATAEPTIEPAATAEPVESETTGSGYTAWYDAKDLVVSVKYGKLSDAQMSVSDNSLFVLVDADESGPSTLGQNFENVADLVARGATRWDSLEYYVYADHDGTFDMVLGFTITKDAMQSIVDGSVTADNFTDHVDDFYSSGYYGS